ncbi:MAG: hypothetical protein ACPGJS_04130 [Flammeovirgaceae bacterium]
MKELVFAERHLRNIVRQRLEKEFDKCKYTEKGELILMEKPKTGKVAIHVTKDGFKILPLSKKKSFWMMALITAFIIQVIAFGIEGLPKYFTMLSAFLLILGIISVVSAFTSSYSKNRFFAERIEEYLEKELLVG